MNCIIIIEYKYFRNSTTNKFKMEEDKIQEEEKSEKYWLKLETPSERR